MVATEGDMAHSKVCFKCGISKTINDFYKHSAMSDGRLGKCKECTKKDVSEHRMANLDRIRAYDRERAKLPHRALLAAKQCKKWRKEDKRRLQCHNAVARALRKGTLIHKACEWFGCTRQDSLAHHESYDRPLEVVFYCQPHHKQRHKDMKRLGIIP